MAKEFMDVLIPIHGALPHLRSCINSLFQNTTNLRLILVNDFSNDLEMDQYLAEVQRDQKSTITLRTGKQHWFTRAVNLGLRVVRTERVVILNSDCIVNPGWLEELENTFDELVAGNVHREIGMVGSFHVGPDHPRFQETRKNTSYDYVTGHCILVSMNALHRVAFQRGTPGWFFDETQQSNIHINSDRIMCYEMNALGIATFCNYHAQVHHVDGASWGHNLGKVFSIQMEDVDWKR